MKILFLIKGNSGYGYGGPKSGLLESAKLTAGELIKYLHVKAKVVICIDGNDVDREVYQYKPDLCIIEAIWVTPEKLKEVQRLHPKVKFYVRVHSEIPFLATEGVAIDWILKYATIKNTGVSFNSEVTNEDFSRTIIEDAVYLPNIYTHVESHNVSLWEEIFSPHRKERVINIGCFGAIRPMKNQLLQAFAAVQYGYENHQAVHFHINSARTEQGGENVLKNIRALFKGSHHKLIEHKWLPRHEFLQLVSRMDIGLQVSFTESFNIITADFVLSGVPIISSYAIRWLPDSSKSEIDANEISERIKRVLRFKKHYAELNKKYLNRYNVAAIETWKCFLRMVPQ